MRRAEFAGSHDQRASARKQNCAANGKGVFISKGRSGTTEFKDKRLNCVPLELRANHQHSAYSYLKLSTGSNFAARAAGTVPNRIPTNDETTIATIADNPEIGTRYSVRKRME